MYVYYIPVYICSYSFTLLTTYSHTLSTHPTTAGKTETTKKVLSFLANIAPDLKAKSSLSEAGMEDKILQSNPLLEALGNAKTLRNSKYLY